MYSDIWGGDRRTVTCVVQQLKELFATIWLQPLGPVILMGRFDNVFFCKSTDQLEHEGCATVQCYA